jgi:hypothetical protein
MIIKKILSLSCLCLLGFVASAKADTVTDTSLDVKYTVTSSFIPVSGNTYDVFLTIDPTAFNAGTGFLTAFTLQFKTGSDVSTAVSLVSAPGGVADWSPEIPGGLNSGGCNGNGASSGDVCFQNLGSAGTTVPGGPYNFELAVTMPGSDALTAASDIKAAYNTLQNNDGKNLGLTSMGITIQTSTVPTVPEPSTLMLLGTGALGLAGAIKRRLA